jgi:hypothetical protein
MPPETALLQQEWMTFRQFRGKPSLIRQGGGSKEEAGGYSLGNQVFGSRWHDAESLGLDVRRLLRLGV